MEKQSYLINIDCRHCRYSMGVERIALSEVPKYEKIILEVDEKSCPHCKKEGKKIVTINDRKIGNEFITTLG